MFGILVVKASLGGLSIFYAGKVTLNTMELFLLFISKRLLQQYGKILNHKSQRLARARLYESQRVFFGCGGLSLFVKLVTNKVCKYWLKQRGIAISLALLHFTLQ